MVLFYSIIILFVCYSLLLFYYWLAWQSIPLFKKGSEKPSLKISVIIAARNEEKNIRPLLSALQNQTYPSSAFEVIVVDDHSSDKTAEIVHAFDFVKLFRLQDDNQVAYKKKAIERGVSIATGDFIVTTDADCIPGENWLLSIAAFQTSFQSVCIAAPVVFDHRLTVLSIFQTLDFMVLQGITGVAVDKHIFSMSNGANFGYSKKAFHAVNGFRDIDTIASGDDVLLMQKIRQRFPTQVHYLKSEEAIVKTAPMPDLQSFIEQRKRWAGKTKFYTDTKLKLILLLVFIFHLSLAATIIYAVFFPAFWWLLLGIWIGKTVVEFPFLYHLARFFKKQSLLKYFFFLQPIHIFYTLFIAVASQFGQYEWKGRKLK